jgi:hypothetical protein
MKIRQGFVSNSSSSSFVLIGSEIDKHATKEIFNKFPVYVTGPGWEYTTEYRIKDFDEFRELINFLNDEEIWSLTFISALFAGSECDGTPIDIQDFGEDNGQFKVWSGEADYHPSSVKHHIEELQRARDNE